jgi:hypothetical protein
VAALAVAGLVFGLIQGIGPWNQAPSGFGFGGGRTVTDGAYTWGMSAPPERVRVRQVLPDGTVVSGHLHRATAPGAAGIEVVALIDRTDEAVDEVAALQAVATELGADVFGQARPTWEIIGQPALFTQVRTDDGGGDGGGFLTALIDGDVIIVIGGVPEEDDDPSLLLDRIEAVSRTFERT